VTKKRLRMVRSGGSFDARWLCMARVNVYFGGKLIRADGVAVVHDRLGSVVARVTCGLQYAGGGEEGLPPVWG
jgi:hypothetical protein